MCGGADGWVDADENSWLVAPIGRMLRGRSRSSATPSSVARRA